MREYQEKAQALGLQDPVLFQHLAMCDPKLDIALRTQIANNIASYFHPRQGVVPPPPPRFEEQITLPHPRPATIPQARENITYLIDLKTTGRIDRKWGDNLIADQRILLNCLLDEAKLLAANGDVGDQVIHIQGGLPPLPGTNITMPQLGDQNGFDLLKDNTAFLKDVTGARQASPPGDPSEVPSNPPAPPKAPDTPS
jgi:hypothetical protein